MADLSKNSNVTNERLKNVAAFLLLFAVFIIITTRFSPPSSEERFEKLWLEDFQTLQKSKSLPAGFSNLGKVEYMVVAPKLHEYLKTHKQPDFQIKSGGKYKLEILMDQLESGGVMMQYDLLDERGNTIWELGRTFNQKLFTN